MKTSIVYPGTFDPITLGHVDIIQRAAKLFEYVWVVVAPTSRKAPYFSIEERMRWVQSVFQDVSGIEVVSFPGLLVDFIKENGVTAILRGLRAVSDFDYEFQLSHMNLCLLPHLETIFLPAKPELSYISGSLIREVISLGGDISAFVPPVVSDYLDIGKTQTNK